ncbi:hypothetical protein AB0I00_07225 [Streptomyces sp. NPDC050803]|uniref:hypothetical protein n=1 Tax=unclassified Streptomyces TaxID=2593676 RepID=UPI00341BEEFC
MPLLMLFVPAALLGAAGLAVIRCRKANRSAQAQPVKPRRLTLGKAAQIATIAGTALTALGVVMTMMKS